MFNNRYVKLGLLTVALAVLAYLLMWALTALVGFSLPGSLMWMLAFLLSGYIVYQFFSQHIY